MSAQFQLPRELYGVIGWPLGHSLSPLLHNTAFRQRHIPAVYMRWEIAPDQLAHFVDSMRLLGIGGCSVTLPHKLDIMPLLDHVEPQARLAGAVNTVYRSGNKLCGDNTDVTGFLAPLMGLPVEDMSVLILGAGGAAHAVVAGLQQCGCRQVFTCTPGNSSHKELAAAFGLNPLRWEQRHDLPVQCVINTTPLGMRGAHQGESPFHFHETRAPAGLAYDVVYTPLETRFLREARAHGWQCISGLDMFYAQGAAQFKLWTGQSMPPACRAVLEKALA